MSDIPADYKQLFTHGFVGLVDVMGNDAAIVQAARVAYNQSTTISRSDAGLINYLMRNQHTSPFEMCELKFHIRAPIFVLRQWVRHRMANWNEESGRYSVLQEHHYVPDAETVSGQHATNKQQRGGGIDELSRISSPNIIHSSNKASFETYDYLLQSGVARELSRTVLPLGAFSTIFWKIDLHNLFRFLKLRLDEHAQFEIQEYAKLIRSFAEEKFPVAFDAWENHVNKAVIFSQKEMTALPKMRPIYPGTLPDRMEEVRDSYAPDMTANEFSEFVKKIPWLQNS